MSRNIRRLTHSEEFSNYYMSVDESEDLEHFGKLGMKWGQRLYQYKDGSLTPLGRVHYGIGSKRAKQMHEKGYTLGDYEGYKSYKKIQKTSSYRDRGWKLKKEAGDSYNEDIISDSAKRRASRNYYEDMHRRKPLIMALASKDDKQKISELAEKYANSEDYRRAKEFLDKHKDEFINKPEEKKIDIQDKELSINVENNSNTQIPNGYTKEQWEKQKERYKSFASTSFNDWAVSKGYESSEDYMKEGIENRWFEDVTDDGLMKNEKDLIKDFGLSAKDLVVLSDGEGVYRRDGKDFVFQDETGYKYYAPNTMNAFEMKANGFKPVLDNKYSFEEESKKYGLKSDQYYEDLYNNALQDPDMKKTFNKWAGYGETKKDIIRSEKLYDETFKEIDPDRKLFSKDQYDDRRFMFRGSRKDKNLIEYKGKVYTDIDSIVDEKTFKDDRSFGKVNDEKHRTYQRVLSLKNSGLTFKEIAKKLNIPEGTASSYYYLMD